MIKGEKYRIISEVVPGMWNKPREMVFTYIGEDDNHIPPIYIFSARPEAGTQEMPKRQVARIIHVDFKTPILLPRIYRGGAD